jgi:CRISPR system Cascade subunit CasD
MTDLLALRFDAPLMSFGGVVVDNLGVVQNFPALSLVTGLLANALGYDHAQVEAHQALQGRIRYSVRCDRRGERIQDFQTVDLGQDFLVGTGWTTRGKAHGRDGASSKGTHIRYRDYQADSIHTVALTLLSSDQGPSLDAVAKALQLPARPLFLGRKCCLPAAPILLGRYQAEDLYQALALIPLPPAGRRDPGPTYRAWWPEGDGVGQAGRTLMACDHRDWANQIHVGQRNVREGFISIPGDNHEH